MSYEQLEFASSFASEQCPEGLDSKDDVTLLVLCVFCWAGFVAISGNTLRDELGGTQARFAGIAKEVSHSGILACERLGELFNQTALC